MSKHTSPFCTALVTGADGGLGLEIARQLAAQNATVILHTRTPESGEQAVKELVAGGAQSSRLHYLAADFTELAEVAAMAHYVTREYPRLDLLVNNAAVFGGQTRTLTSDGHETTLQVNYLAPYLLTRMLWPSLTAVPGARVVNVSSALHRGGRLHWGDVESAKRYSAAAAYAQSKLALTVFTKAVAVRGGTDLIAASVHPGVLDTDMGRHYTREAGRPVSEGAAAVLRLASASERVRDGGYYEGAAEAVANLVVDDQNSVNRLWKLSARLVGLAA